MFYLYVKLFKHFYSLFLVWSFIRVYNCLRLIAVGSSFQILTDLIVAIRLRRELRWVRIICTLSETRDASGVGMHCEPLVTLNVNVTEPANNAFLRTRLNVTL